MPKMENLQNKRDSAPKLAIHCRPERDKLFTAGQKADSRRGGHEWGGHKWGGHEWGGHEWGGHEWGGHEWGGHEWGGHEWGGHEWFPLGLP